MTLQARAAVACACASRRWTSAPSSQDGPFPRFVCLPAQRVVLNWQSRGLSTWYPSRTCSLQVTQGTPAAGKPSNSPHVSLINAVSLYVSFLATVASSPPYASPVSIVYGSPNSRQDAVGPSCAGHGGQRLDAHPTRTASPCAQPVPQYLARQCAQRAVGKLADLLDWPPCKSPLAGHRRFVLP